MVRNNKSEFDRYKILRLQLEKIDEEKLRSMGEQELMEDINTSTPESGAPRSMRRGRGKITTEQCKGAGGGKEQRRR